MLQDMLLIHAADTYTSYLFEYIEFYHLELNMYCK